jgi:C1A family cysteine protease
MRTALAQGKSIVMAVLVYASFMSAGTIRSGKIPMPNTGRERLLGGHAITLTGYDFGRAVFFFRNSWGVLFREGLNMIAVGYPLWVSLMVRGVLCR